MAPLPTALLLAAGVGLFAFTLHRVLRGAERLDRLGERVDSLLRSGIGQGRVLVGNECGRCRTRRPTHVTGRKETP